MIRIETREQVKAIVMQSPEGISLTQLHNKFHRIMTRLQLRTVLTSLYKKGEISRERVCALNRRETQYYPFNGKPPVTREKRIIKLRDKKMLSMKDFMPGKKYQAYIEF